MRVDTSTLWKKVLYGLLPIPALITLPAIAAIFVIGRAAAWLLVGEVESPSTDHNALVMIGCFVGATILVLFAYTKICANYQRARGKYLRWLEGKKADKEYGKNYWNE